MSEWIYRGTNKIHRTAIIEDCVTLGENNIIFPNTVIGFPGFIRGATSYLGQVVIGDNNRIGCNVCIMIGLDGITKIGNNNLVMNNVNIGHNSEIGDDNEIGAGTICAGWSTVGNHNNIKLSVTIRNRVKIGDRNVIGMCSNVVSSFTSNSVIYGNPAKFIRLRE